MVTLDLGQSSTTFPFYILIERHQLSSSTLGEVLRHPCLNYAITLCSSTVTVNRMCKGHETKILVGIQAARYCKTYNVKLDIVNVPNLQDRPAHS